MGLLPFHSPVSVGSRERSKNMAADAPDPTMHRLSQADLALVIARVLAERKSRSAHQRQLGISAALQVAGETIADALVRDGYVVLHPVNAIDNTGAVAQALASKGALPPHPAD
jgi:hypothetical protein